MIKIVCQKTDIHYIQIIEIKNNVRLNFIQYLFIFEL